MDPRALTRLRKLGGDELVGRMIDLFVTHAEPKVRTAMASFEAGELEEVERSAHSIRSSAGNLGADELREIAGSVEQLAAAKQHETLRPLLQDLENAFARAKALLEKERRRTQA